LRVSRVSYVPHAKELVHQKRCQKIFGAVP
jgi:hypothetical protein